VIPVSIVTGKTTLIGRIVRDPAFARTAVIIGECGEIGSHFSRYAVAFSGAIAGYHRGRGAGRVGDSENRIFFLICYHHV